jgi:SAM-dependent methyltransferase
MFNYFRKRLPQQQVISDPDFGELKRKFSQTWQNEGLPLMQEKFTQTILNDYMAINAITSLIELVKKISKKKSLILEIGCSTGYLGKIFKIEKLGLDYEGCNYSKAFIKKARELYPELKFEIDDATSLSYSKDKFDIVISGCCILHILNFPKAISEAARVAKKYVIFHRTPVIHFQKTTYTTKRAYGVDMLEIIFNEGELVDRINLSGLAVMSTRMVGQYQVPGINEPIFIKEYLCIKN